MWVCVLSLIHWNNYRTKPYPCHIFDGRNAFHMLYVWFWLASFFLCINRKRNPWYFIHLMFLYESMMTISMAKQINIIFIETYKRLQLVRFYFVLHFVTAKRINFTTKYNQDERNRMAWLTGPLNHVLLWILLLSRYLALPLSLCLCLSKHLNGVSISWTLRTSTVLFRLHRMHSIVRDFIFSSFLSLTEIFI